MNKGKRIKEIAAKVDREKLYAAEEAVALVKDNAKAKFDESVECAVRLGIDPKKTDQMVRSSVTLPNGTGKEIRILVLCKGEKEAEAKEAGADFVGSAELVEKIQGGWLDFDAMIATPDMMKDVGKLGRVLGPRGLMPSPKSGTVTNDVAAMIKQLKAGRVEYRNDKQGNINVAFGKASFTAQALSENLTTLVASMMQVKPNAVKGTYIKSISVSSTMGIGVKIDGQTLGVK